MRGIDRKAGQMLMGQLVRSLQHSGRNKKRDPASNKVERKNPLLEVVI